ncbi:MAG: transposase [Rhodoferax sp.]|nr:transposase [Rhodoferax sp.]
MADSDSNGDSEEARVLRPLQAAACTYRIAFGPRAGQKVLTVQGAMPRQREFKQTLCADVEGLSLHAAAVRCGAYDRQALEQLCRYITRPAVPNERVQTNAAGQVVLRLKTPWRDGTTHLVMSPLEFMQRLAAPVPRPRLHLIRLHGVLAPHLQIRLSCARWWCRKRCCKPPSRHPRQAKPAECEANCTHHRSVRLSWVKLLKRVLDLDLEHCPNCDGELKIIAAILEQPGNRKDPHTLGSAGPGAASGAGSRPGASSGLRPPNLDSSGDPANRAAGLGWVAEFTAPIGSGLTTRDNPPQKPKKDDFGGAVKAQPSCATFNDRHTRVEGRVSMIFCWVVQT